jgi:hypothetical protein
LDKPDIAWHLHNCQNGGDLSVIDRDGFDALVAAWTGCMELVERAVVGRVSKGPGERGRGKAYREKRDEGWEKGGGRWYESEKSGLRRVEILNDEGREVVRGQGDVGTEVIYWAAVSKEDVWCANDT